MLHEDYEREHLKDQVYLMEERILLEKEYYEWLGNQAKIIVENDNDKETGTAIGDGVGHEPLFRGTLPAEWGEPATTPKDYVIASHIGKEAASGSSGGTVSSD